MNDRCTHIVVAAPRRRAVGVPFITMLGMVFVLLETDCPLFAGDATVVHVAVVVMMMPTAGKQPRGSQIDSEAENGDGDCLDENVWAPDG